MTKKYEGGFLRVDFDDSGARDNGNSDRYRITLDADQEFTVWSEESGEFTTNTFTFDIVGNWEFSDFCEAMQTLFVTNQNTEESK